jgi:hypothetical protein
MICGQCSRDKKGITGQWRIRISYITIWVYNFGSYTMKNVINKITPLFLVISILSCTGLTDKEVKSIKILESKFPDYKFAKHSDISEAYLTVRLRKSRVDSLELKSVYKELIEIERETLPSGQPIVNWVYLIVYSNKGEYLFTIVENNDDKIVFFEDAIR